ncbi:MAG: DUF896 domain-containing protein [Ruminococcaceae bacterium]|nr:DUF896 domain-containing protein [Oscillospiraceae bacterium]MBD5117222.1 DUF896 domain-containing protein [Oscillospiraceae bacterium]
MEKAKIERINFLAAKARNEGLSEEEKAEQQILRDEYREGFRKNLTAQLDNTYIIDENGNKTKLNKRGE